MNTPHGMMIVITTRHDARDDQAQAVQHVHRADVAGLHRGVLLSATAPAAPGRSGRRRVSSCGYWTAWMRSISSASCAAVLVPHRLHRLAERLLVGDLDHLDAVRLHVGQRLLLLGVPELALALLRLLGEAHDQVLILLGQLFPDALREHQDLRDHQMLGARVVLRVPVMLAARVGRVVVLGAVDHAGLQRR